MGKLPDSIQTGLGTRTIHVSVGDRTFVIGGDEHACDIAERFVATWNACAGIPTEQLEAGAVERMKIAAANALEMLECLECEEEAAVLRQALAPFQKESD